ncbi:APC family permease [Desulfurococcus amylolyticus]|uniref:Amino acid/polyamine/organocation transporter, APC superfamily n=1 Tax=Desulfurococcus amylolyticus DSM 16532 TaxID=768672 RepID=I3XRT3_DESAM|nr:amino acid permease [Desulfurococcus amylolyticus]AFL66657.1 amino acid/polyamine/organocation transporter, APC superfamily [Desulfurococcus amylolyticus DSM 16532]
MSDEESSFTVFRAYLLRREFTWFDIFLWVIANPLASGLLYYSVSATGSPGFYGGVVPYAFLFAGLIFIPIALLFMIIASSLPRSASPYILVSRVFGMLPGFLSIALYLFLSGGLLTLGFLAYSSTGILSDGFIVSGYITNNSYLIMLGESLKSVFFTVIIALIVVTFLFVATMFGRRVIKILLYVSVAAPLVLYIAILVSLYPFSSKVFINNWNTLFNDSYGKIISIALYGGVVDGVVVNALKPVNEWSATFALLGVAMYAYLGLENASFIAGEVKDPVSSYFKGYITGFTTLTALYTVTPVIITLIAGYDFLSAYSYLYHYYPGVLKIIMGTNTPPSPSLTTIISVYTGNTYTSLIFTAVAYLFYFNTMLTIWISGIRALLALSQDHLMPRFLARISRRASVPHYSNLFIYVLSTLVLLLTIFIKSNLQLELSFLKIMNLGYSMFLVFTGLSLISVPLFSEKLYNRFTYRSRGLLYIVGYASSTIGFGLVLAAGANASLIDVVVATSLFGAILLLFIAVTTYMEHRGVRYEEVFSRIPPM